MPIYEYRCQACGHELEATQRMSDAPLTDCPACGTSQLVRLISRSAFVLKGGGWYKDLYSSPKDGSTRTEADRADRLSKAIKDDAQKSEAASGSSEGSSSSGAQSTDSSSTAATGAGTKPAS